MCTNSGNILHALDICDMVKHKLRIESSKAQVEIQKCEFKSTSSRIIKSMQIQVNSLLKQPNKIHFLRS